MLYKRCNASYFQLLYVMLPVYMDAEDEQLLEDEMTVPTDSKRSVLFLQLVLQPVAITVTFTHSRLFELLKY